jgi:tetratricopeptide (TPR) repeat protein
MEPAPPRLPATLESTPDSSDPVSTPAEGPVQESRLLQPLDELRFEVGGELARGGIGRILEARDELLGRRLALKELLRPEHPATMARFMREAMITARLQHPAIVPVYDAGVRRSGEPYYTMPLVPGKNLYQAIHELDTLEQRMSLLPHVQAVADAVAYAHEQGVVHRDLKPSNILVGPFGETIVIDWGLAKDLGAPEPTPDAEPGPEAGLLLDELGLALDATRTGVARGTPRYLSPAHAKGQPIDPRSDVYALGAVLYHVLAGHFPHGSELEPIDVVEPRVPRDLVSIVGKAMAARPEDRYPSAQLLALDLRRFATGQLVGARRYRPWTRLLRFLRRHRVTVAASLVMAAITAAIAIPIAHRAGKAPLCGGDDAIAAKVWNPARAAAIRAQFDKLGGAVATAQWDRAAPLFAAYAGRWASLRHDSCQATRVRHTQSDSLFDRRQFCFDRRLAQLDSVAGALLRFDSVPLALKATEVASGLPSLDVCATAAFVKDANLPPLEQRAAVEAAYEQLDAARALEQVGREREALAAYQALEPRARELGFAPLGADLALAIGFVAHSLGEDAVSVAAYERGEELAAGLGRTDQVFEAEAGLMRLEAYAEKYEHAAGRRTAQAALAQLSANPDHVVQHHENLGLFYSYQHRDAEALAEFKQALALLPAGGHSPREASVHDGIGTALMRLRRYDEAEPELERALALREERYGAQHPLVANSLNQLGNLAIYRKQYPVALERYQRALAIRRAVSAGKDNAEIALSVGNVAVAQEKLQDYEAALATYQEALALKRRVFGPTHRETAKTLTNEANVLVALGRYDEAVAAKRESTAMTLLLRKPDDPLLIENYGDLGETLVLQGESAADAGAARAPCTAALVELDKALALSRPKGGKPPHFLYGAVLLLRARTFTCLRRYAEARAEVQAALDLDRKATPVDPDPIFEDSVMLAEILLAEGRAASVLALLAPFTDAKVGTSVQRAQAVFARAQALAATGHASQAIPLARQALAVFEASKDIRAAILARRVQTWLAHR